MKLPILVVLSLILSLSTYGQDLTNKTDSLSYALGMDLGNNLKQLDMGLNNDLIYQGMVDQLGGQNTKLTDQQLQALLQAFQLEVQAAQQAKQAAVGEAAKAEGAAFLATNKEREGVQVTPSGLQYEVISEGEGAKPFTNSTVKVHYKGSLLSGEVFDSSYDRGTPIEFPLNRVIPGWTEGLQLMSVGSKYKLYIPYELGYGANGAPPKIPPYSTLIFEVELLEIK